RRSWTARPPRPPAGRPGRWRSPAPAPTSRRGTSSFRGTSQQLLDDLTGGHALFRCSLLEGTDDLGREPDREDLLQLWGQRAVPVAAAFMSVARADPGHLRLRSAAQIRRGDQALVAAKLGSAAFVGHRALLEDVGTVGHGERAVHELLDQEDRYALAPEGVEEPEELLDDGRGKALRHLVDQHQLRPDEERPGH